ncbi:MAG: 50S ribosome-binding GTPase [Nanoarchaeota archaeon]|nr:50S ribosome-binding GTPase [Nanoarchaeota archaeon]
MVRVRYSFGSRHTGHITNIKKQRGKYPDVMKDVVRISDIILEILDARYIEETRNMEVEEDILSSKDDLGRPKKVLIYVFNKVDLVDRKELEKQIPSWMKPYVFISATEKIGLRDITARIKMEAKRILKQRLGGEIEIKEDKGRFNKIEDKKARDAKAKATYGDVVKDMESKKRIHVGVIGYPNAGKSSVINFITHRAAAKTAKQAGFTKGMQKIRMSDDILILDTPGVIPASKYSTESKSFAQDVKVGGRTYSNVKDPEDVVYYLMVAPDPKDADNVTDKEKNAIKDAEVNAKKIEDFYGFEGLNVEEFIESLGKKKGFLGKGGKVDVDRSARVVLRDWQEGRIK